MIIALFFVSQLIAFGVLLARLLPGRHRQPPVAPVVDGEWTAGESVSVIVTSLNEAHRIAPCLTGLQAQGRPMIEVIVVDSRSSDGTPALVQATAAHDSRFRLTNDPPLPPDWIGKVWALQHGLSEARGTWVLGVDADTEPQPGMVGGALRAALDGGYDVLSFSPRFAGQTAAEQWLQPSMLLTLVYRFGAAGRETPPADRVMANGQCFLARRDVLLANGGYEVARRSFCDDVTLARYYASRGAKVGFLDGSRLYVVRAYESMGQMWREWGRSLDLQDAASRTRQWSDVLFLALTQGAPVMILLAALIGIMDFTRLATQALLGVNAAFLFIRVMMLFALRGAYVSPGATFWLSPFADPLAAWRIFLSTVRRPKGWRGRVYTLESAGAQPPLPNA